MLRAINTRAREHEQYVYAFQSSCSVVTTSCNRSQTNSKIAVSLFTHICVSIQRVKKGYYCPCWSVNHHTYNKDGVEMYAETVDRFVWFNVLLHCKEREGISNLVMLTCYSSCYDKYPLNRTWALSNILLCNNCHQCGVLLYIPVLEAEFFEEWYFHWT